MSCAGCGDRILGRRIYRFESVTSTNDVARSLVLQQADEGTVVVAAEQTSGRGSRGRTWLGEAGMNLLLSLIVRPTLEPAKFSELAFVAAVGLADYLIYDVNLPARVKWPNDVCVGSRKIAGILIEAAPMQGDQHAAIVGMGINVNWVQLPADIAETATSIRLESGHPIDIDLVLQGVMDHLDSVYRLFIREGFGAIMSGWKAVECSTGSAVRVESSDGAIEGRVESIDSDGTLVVRLQNGRVQRISAASLVVAS